MYGNAAAPPPTPSAGAFTDVSTSAAADALANLLNNLPSTNLSLPPRRRTPRAATPAAASSEDKAPPTVSFSEENLAASLSELLLSPSGLGFFQLTDHPVAPGLARAAESDALALLDLDPDQKGSYFPAKNWPLGFEGGSFCLDGSCRPGSAELTEPVALTSMREFVAGMEGLGLEVLRSVSGAVGFEDPIGDDPTRFRTLVTIAEATSPGEDEKPGWKYPFVVRLQYQVRSQRYSLVTDSGPVTCVSPQVDSVLVSLGDILQVWSNGKVKKVRGSWAVGSNNNMNSRCVSMTVELTLPINTMVSPLLPIPHRDNDRDGDDEKAIIENKFKFKPFLFDEIYAWKVSHSGILFNDPLDKYRVDQSM